MKRQQPHKAARPRASLETDLFSSQLISPLADRPGLEHVFDDDEEEDKDIPPPPKRSFAAPRKPATPVPQSDSFSDDLDTTILNRELAQIELHISDDDEEDPAWTSIVPPAASQILARPPQFGADSSDSDFEQVVIDGTDDGRFNSDFAALLRKHKRGKQPNWKLTIDPVPVKPNDKVAQQIINEHTTLRLIAQLRRTQ